VTDSLERSGSYLLTSSKYALGWPRLPSSGYKALLLYVKILERQSGAHVHVVAKLRAARNFRLSVMRLIAMVIY
jgi:hypothetical protein